MIPLAPVFHPTMIPGLGLWLDATETSFLTFNGSTVSEIRDKSGNARHYSQGTTASQPTVSTINGRQCLASTATRIMTGNAAANATAQNAPGLTIVAVGKVGSNASADLVFFSNGISGGSARAAIRQTGGANGVLAGGRCLDANSFASVEHATSRVPAIHTACFDYSNSDLYLYLNGTLAASSTSFQTDGSSSNTASIQSAILGSAVDCLLGELLIWPRALTSGERLAVERYLGRKWAI